MKILCEFETYGIAYELFETANFHELDFIKADMSMKAYRYFNCKNEFNIASIYKRYFEMKHIKSVDYAEMGSVKSKNQTRKLYWKERNEFKCKIAQYEYELDARKKEYFLACKKYNKARIAYDERAKLFLQFLAIKKKLEEV